MKWAILALFAFTCFLAFTALLQTVLLSDRKLNKRLNRYLHLNDKKKLTRRSFNLMVQMQLYKQTVREKLLTKKKGERLETMLARAGVAMRPEEYMLFQWIAAVLAGGLLFILTGKGVLMAVGGAAGYMLPRRIVKKKERERIAAFNDGLQDMITTVIGSLRAGFSFAQALKTVVQESENPIREEMETVLKEMQFGTSMEEALHHLKERMPSGDLDLMIQSILIQRQIGGNLAVILETIVQTIRDRNKIQRQIRTLTAQGRLSGRVIGLLPIALALLLYVIEPEYIGTLFRHPAGWMMLAAGSVSGTIGFLLVRRITRIEV